MTDTLPTSFKPYFWDVDFETLNWQEKPNFVLKRIIDKGGLGAWKWAQERFSLDQVKNLVTTSRDLNRRTATFWSRIFNLNPQEIPCLRKPYSPMPFSQ